MKSKSSSRRFVLGCAAISLAAAMPGFAQAPAIALIDPSDAAQWEPVAKEAGWRVIAPAAAATTPDARVQSLVAAVEQAIGQGADASRIYLAGRGPAAALVFY